MIIKEQRKVLKHVNNCKNINTESITDVEKPIYSFLCEKNLIQIKFIPTEFMDGYTVYEITQLGKIELKESALFNGHFVITQIILPIVIAIITTLLTIFLTSSL